MKFTLWMLDLTEFSSLNGISDLAQKRDETKKDQVYPLVYLLMKLALNLPIATTIIERVFFFCYEYYEE